MPLPLADWQFWLVTVVAAWGFYALVRPFLPRRSSRREPPCANCAVGTATRAALEVRGKTPEKVPERARQEVIESQRPAAARSRGSGGVE